MSRDKQIEEMASILMDKCDRELDCSKKADCDMCRAELLVEKGYRKASEVAREIFEEIDKLIIRRMIADSPLIDDRLITDIAELKKKYTVTDTNVGCKDTESEKDK